VSSLVGGQLLSCVNMTWTAKGTFVSVLLSFLYRVSMALQCQCGIRESASHLHLEMGCNCRGGFFFRLGVLSGLPPPFFSWFASCDLWRVRFLVVPLPPCGPPLLGSLLAWTSVLAPCFLFSPLLGCFF
jgi:hypothetical protein